VSLDTAVPSGSTVNGVWPHRWCLRLL